MAEFYSDYFTETGSTQATIPDPRTINSPGTSHGRIRYKRATVTGTITTSDVARMFPLRSSDRLVNLLLSSDGATAGAAAVNVGAHTAGVDHDGAVVDADRFASALAIDTNVTQSNAYSESASFVHELAGAELWEQLGVASAPDPVIEYDIAITPSTSMDASTVLVLEAHYIAGD